MSDDSLRWIFAAGDGEELTARYDAWAATYDDDHDAWGWVGPAKAVERLFALGPPAVVLDAGCGTGGVGRHLRATGWAGELAGVDLSRGMLRRAEAGGWYDRLVQGSVTALPFADESADAYVATGVYTHGHVGAEGFAEALRVVKPGGVVVLTVRVSVWAALEPDVSRLEQLGAWERLERTDPVSFHPGGSSENHEPQSIVIWRNC